MQIAYHREHGHEVERCLTAIQQSSELASAARETTHRRIEAYRGIFDRARARGELDAGISYQEFVDVLSAPLLGRVLTGQRLSDEWVEQAVELVLQGLGRARDT